jgi:hypothetical protein
LSEVDGAAGAGAALLVSLLVELAESVEDDDSLFAAGFESDLESAGASDLESPEDVGLALP